MKWFRNIINIIRRTDEIRARSNADRLSSITTTTTALQVQSPEGLLDNNHRRSRIEELRTLVSVPAEHFRALYLFAIHSYARYVQQLPASEAHHHCSPGGMLDHGLEVAVTALRIRRGYLLPQGAEPEDIARQAELWSYAIFVSALLHDIGKPLVNHRISLCRSDGTVCGIWDPLTGPMNADGYMLEFNRNRSYRFHERVPLLVAHHIVPGVGLAWIGSDHSVLSAWVASLTGHHDDAGLLSDIISQADQSSVAANLGAGQDTRFNAARQVPLHQKLMTALRVLIEEQVLPLNRNGAAGWLCNDDLWLVSKRVADAMRDQLSHEGHTGIPTRNDRLFDVLQEHGILVPNNGQAIWRAEVSDSGWAHVLTLLRISAVRVWPQESSRPPSFEGRVIPIKDGVEDEIISGSEEPEASDTVAGPLEDITIARTTSLTRQTAAVGRTNDEDVNNAATPKESLPEESLNANTDEGRLFMDWLTSGLARRQIKINQADARIHGVNEGVLLVSPAIFKDYGRATGDHQAWERAQKRFLKLRLHERAIDGTNIIQYRVELPGGNHRGKVHTIKGVVINDRQLLGSSAPEVNPLLKRVES